MSAQQSRRAPAEAGKAAVSAVATAADESSPPPIAAQIAAAGRTVSPAGTFVVSGVDGSATARHAARWAATEAVHRGAALRLVYAFQLPFSGSSIYDPYPANLLETIREEGQTQLEKTATELRREHPTLDITTQLTYGDPATVLRCAASDAVLTVVGGKGTNPLAVALGSVAANLAATNPAPVAVIHQSDAAASGPVVVGVDASSTSESVLAFAFQAASARRAPLTAVLCWTDPAIDGPVPSYREMIADPNPIEAAERVWLSKRIAGLVERYPDVTVTQVLVHDRPTPTLIEFARTAQLVVVGNRGHGGLAGMLLGSTSQGLITHSSSPVVVVRTHGVR